MLFIFTCLEAVILVCKAAMDSTISFLMIYTSDDGRAIPTDGTPLNCPGHLIYMCSFGCTSSASMISSIRQRFVFSCLFRFGLSPGPCKELTGFPRLWLYCLSFHCVLKTSERNLFSDYHFCPEVPPHTPQRLVGKSCFQGFLSLLS